MSTQPGTTSVRGNYALLTADGLRLLLPQGEVGAVEYLEGELEPAEVPGLLKLGSQDSPGRFVALSDALTLHEHCPPGRFLVTTLGRGNDDLGWCWTELKILIDVELDARPLPPALLGPHSPITHYAEIDGRLVYLCDAERVVEFALSAGNP